MTRTPRTKILAAHSSANALGPIQLLPTVEIVAKRKRKIFSQLGRTYARTKEATSAIAPVIKRLCVSVVAKMEAEGMMASKLPGNEDSIHRCSVTEWLATAAGK